MVWRGPFQCNLLPPDEFLHHCRCQICQCERAFTSLVSHHINASNMVKPRYNKVVLAEKNFVKSWISLIQGFEASVVKTILLISKAFLMDSSLLVSTYKRITRLGHNSANCAKSKALTWLPGCEICMCCVTRHHKFWCHAISYFVLAATAQKLKTKLWNHANIHSVQENTNRKKGQSLGRNVEHWLQVAIAERQLHELRFVVLSLSRALRQTITELTQSPWPLSQCEQMLRTISRKLEITPPPTLDAPDPNVHQGTSCPGSSFALAGRDYL